MGDGIVGIIFFVNDTIGNYDNALVNIKKEHIKVNTPVVNQVFGWTAPDFNIAIRGEGLVDNRWYTIDGGVTNYTFSGTTSTINQTAWDGKGNELITVIFYANDSLGNIGLSSVDVIKDTINPGIIINSPTYQQLCGIASPSFDLQIDEFNPYETWYSFNNGQNTTFTTETQFNQVTWDLVSNGTVLINFYVKDEAGNLNFSQVMVRKDAILPQITNYSPLSNEYFGHDAPQYNISIIEEDLNSTWYVVGGEIFSINTWDGTIEQTKWDSLGEGVINITFYAQDNAGNIGYTSVLVNKSLPSTAIYGFNLIIMFGVVSLVSIFLLRKSRRMEKM